MTNRLKTKKIINFLSIILIIISVTGICYAGYHSEDELPNPTGVQDVPSLIGKIIQGVLGVVGSLALLVFIFGGVTWMTSGGNPEKIKKGQQNIIWAVAGIVVIFTSYAVINLIFEILGS